MTSMESQSNMEVLSMAGVTHSGLHAVLPKAIIDLLRLLTLGKQMFNMNDKKYFEENSPPVLLKFVRPFSTGLPFLARILLCIAIELEFIEVMCK